MRKTYVVKNKYEFDEIINLKKFQKNSSFFVYYKKNNLKYDRFGISVGKKLGNAVFRNLYKRRIRCIADNYKKNYVNSTDYIIILRRGALNKSYIELDKDFNNLMNNIRKEINND